MKLWPRRTEQRKVPADLIRDTIELLSEMDEYGDFYGPAAVEALLKRWKTAIPQDNAPARPTSPGARATERNQSCD